MKTLISERLRKIAGFIERDDTPSFEEIKKRREKIDELSQSRFEEQPSSDVQRAREQRRVRGEGDAPKPKVIEEKIDYKAPPKQRAPRRKREYQKKWNEDTQKENMRKYIQEYRQTGRINETMSPKNRYVKKGR